MKIRTVLIDDEEDVRQTTTLMIQHFCPKVEIVGEAPSVATGIQTLLATQPDVVLLDVKMSDGSGFDLLKKMPGIACKVVFVTGHDAFAIQAFKCCALDYLLKPLDSQELVDAFEKAEQALNREQQLIKLDTLIQTISGGKGRIVLRTAESIFVVNTEDIIRCEAAGNYTQFFLAKQKKILVTKTLKEYEELLQPYGFFRLHQSHLINIQQLERFDKKYSTIVLRDQSVLPISVRKRDHLLELLKML